MKPLDHKPKRWRPSLRIYRTLLAERDAADRKVVKVEAKAKNERRMSQLLFEAQSDAHKTALESQIILIDRLREPRRLTLGERIKGWTEQLPLP